jgi:polynucleotide 5'-triphosphatase
MDLKNLISRTSDDENSLPHVPETQPAKRPSQPRLSIHSLMNDNDSNLDKQIESKALDSMRISHEVNETLPIPEKVGPVEINVNSDETKEGAIDNAKKLEGNDIKVQILNADEGKSQEDETTTVKNNTTSQITNVETTLVQKEEKKSETFNSRKESDKLKESKLDGNNKASELETKLYSKEHPQNTLHEQIQQLEHLKQKEEVDDISNDGKPKRYRTKPTWAQDFIPTINRAAAPGTDGIRSFKSDMAYTNISKLDIPSITGSIPRNDFNKLVTEWIWANVEGVKQDYLDVPNAEDYIELELKLGNVWDKVKDTRIQLPINTECVVATDYVNQECFFKPGITIENYNDTKTFMSKIMQEALEQQQQGRGNINNKFVIENSHVIDLIASDSRRNDKPISGRVSLDMKTKRKTNSITKQRISDLYLHFPNTLFDLRLSLSLELPNELNDAAFEVFKKRVSMEREKERISYIHQPTFTRIDLTKVREKNNRVPKYELELEINTPALLRSMRNVMDDPLYFIDLVQAFLDNGRIITRQLSLQRQ